MKRNSLGDGIPHQTQEPSEISLKLPLEKKQIDCTVSSCSFLSEHSHYQPFDCNEVFSRNSSELRNLTVRQLKNSISICSEEMMHFWHILQDTTNSDELLIPSSLVLHLKVKVFNISYQPNTLKKAFQNQE